MQSIISFVLVPSILYLATACLEVPLSETPQMLNIPVRQILAELATPMIPSPTLLPAYKTLTICAGSKPTFLYLYNESNYMINTALDDRSVLWRGLPGFIDPNCVVSSSPCQGN